MQLKKISILMTAVMVFLLSAKVESDHKAATVKQIKGISVFIFSEPVSEYTYLGTVKKSFALTGSNDEMINGVVDKARKEYPTCDGVMFNTFEFEKGEVIKFK